MNPDVRMKGFARRTTVESALQWVDRQTSPLPGVVVPLDSAAGEVLAGDVTSQVDVPCFDRAMMDGFALRAADTLGASPYNPLPLAIVGRSFPGRPMEGRIAPSEAAEIMTGSPLPAGADAVLPVERTEVKGDQLLAQGEVSPGQHVGCRGEDIRAGATVLAAGRSLRPQDLGVLSSIGVDQVEVVRRPTVRIVATGNELLPPGSTPEGCRIADANSPMLQALVNRDGGQVTRSGIVPDEPDAILAAMREPADIVLISGGSSVGREDHAPALLAQHGELPIHGIAMRPAGPTGMGRLDDALVFLLPGNPVACLCAYDFFAGRAVRRLAGRKADWPYRRTRLPLSRKLVSTVGRVECARVNVVDDRVAPLAVSGASVLSSTTRADGFVIIPGDSEGYPPGAEVEVFLYG